MANLKLLFQLIIFFSLISLLPISTFSFSAENPTDRRILVLLDDVSLKSSHSIFFNSLQRRGFDLDFKLADDPKLTLQRYGQYLYDGLILFAPTTERKSKLLNFDFDFFGGWGRNYGNWFCGNFLLLIGFGGSLDLAAVLNFVDSGHDVIVSADANASDLIRNIAAECGVDFDEVFIETHMPDHFRILVC